MYSMTGIIKAQLLPTTKKASTTTGVATCSQKAKAGPTAGEPADMLWRCAARDYPGMWAGWPFLWANCSAPAE